MLDFEHFSGSISRMSSVRHYSGSSFRPTRKKKSYWKPILSLCFLGGCWYAYVECWDNIENWFKPQIVEVHSQVQAMNKLQSMFDAMNGSNEELLNMAKTMDKQVEWMNSAEGKTAFAWLLTMEMDRRGLNKEAEPVLISLLEKKLKRDDKESQTEKILSLKVALNWADVLAARDHDEQAEKLYTIVLNNAPEEEVSTRMACYAALTQYAYDKAQFERFASLAKEANSAVTRSLLQQPEDVQKLVKILLLQDTLPEQVTGVPTGTGSAISEELLKRFKLETSPDMGRIILKGINPILNSRKKFTPQETQELIERLDAATVCFRGSAEAMDCIPETMIAIARLQMQLGNLKDAAQILSRAEGIAMTLGVDAPRILSGMSINQDIAQMRAELERFRQAESLVKKAYEDINLAAAFLKAKDLNQAEKYSNQAMTVALENTSFVQVLQPLILNIQAEISAAREQWAVSEAQYGQLINKWDALSDQEKATLQNNLNTIQNAELYKKIHRAWAEVCKKQNRTTEARRVLTKIGEAPPEEPVKPSRRNRRSNSNR